MTTPFIRPYRKDDWDNGLHIFFTTIDSSVDFEPARTIGSYIWYKAYVSLTPSTCFVLDDGTGRAVGYIIGTPDTLDFAARWRTTFTPIVDPVLVPKPDSSPEDPLMNRPDIFSLRRAVYDAECSMLQSLPSLLSQYPAHFHIDILPEWQSKGWGVKMLDVFFECVREMGARGVHLGMVRRNEGARRFYERVGFGLVGEVLDGGSSGEVGREGEALCLVRVL